jgi:hypothetical protein
VSIERIAPRQARCYSVNADYVMSKPSGFPSGFSSRGDVSENLI